MKRNKLYTVDKGNKNVFDWGGLANNYWSEQQKQGLTGIGVDPTQAYKESTNFLGISKQDNPFSKGNLQQTFSKQGLSNALTGAATGLISAGVNAVGNAAGKALSGGLSSGAGTSISSIGSTVGSAVGMVNPLLGNVVNVGSQLVGGLANRAFGTSVDQAKLNAAKAGTAAYNNFVSNASSFDDVHGPESQANVQNAYKGGWFSSGKAARKNRALKQARIDARQMAFRNVDNNINNLIDDQMNDAMANYSALGGPLDFGSGAIDYGFTQDYLTMKKQQKDARNQFGGNGPLTAFTPQVYALGGDIQMHGGDFSTGLSHIDAGLSHELNPNEGVQVGVDNEGVPNLVEEGETIFNDYVYSTRILADAETKQYFHLPKKRDISFADISKKLEKEISERPNDPISKAGLEAQMSKLAEHQERQKQEMEAERAKAAFEALSPEEQTAVMHQREVQQQAAEQQAMMAQANAQQQMQQPSPEEAAIMQQQQTLSDGSEAMVGPAPQMNAMGGRINRFDGGGYLWNEFWTPVNEYSKRRGSSNNKYQIDRTWKGNIKELESSEDYKNFTDYILNKATDDERTKYFQWIDANTGRDNKYIVDGKLVDNWKDMYQAARTDGLYGIQHYTPKYNPDLGVPTATSIPQETVAPAPGRVFHAMDGDEDYIEGELDPARVGDEIRRETLPNGDTVIYHSPISNATFTEDELTDGNTKEKKPIHRPEWLRYAGLLGPAAGLGLMAAGVGRPDTASLDAAIEGAGNVNLARYKPIDNYLTYRPLDIWYEQNRQNANARATDRVILNASNGNSGAAMAGLLANGYNDQIASGDLFRQAQEYNDNLRKQVEEFNRGTNQFNAEAFSRTSRFNANARNQANQQAASLRLNAAAQKADMDAGWYNSLYGNISGLFRGIGDLGTENFRMNRVSEMGADGIFGNLGESYTGKRAVKAKGGKLKKRGLTI